MKRQFFEQAKRYALQRLEKELPPRLCYHAISHTRDEVAPAAEATAIMEGVQGEEFYLLLTAAWFHDVGYVEQPLNHELISARIAAQVLPAFGYTEEQIEIVRWAILATALPQDPQTLLEKILVDADMDALGREDFMIRNNDLRTELASLGKSFGDEEWFANQIKFLEAHQYFTASAHLRRDAGKQKNIARLKQIWNSLVKK